jgi:hypothetical protein
VVGLMARWRPRATLGRADMVLAAWERAWFEGVRRRLAGLPSAPPSVEALAGLSDDEAAFVTDLAADWVAGAIPELIERRFGPLSRVEPAPLVVAESTIAFDEERLRRRGPQGETA